MELAIESVQRGVRLMIFFLRHIHFSDPRHGPSGIVKRILAAGFLPCRNGCEDACAKSGGLPAAGNFHRAAGNIRIDLHHQRILHRKAAAVHHLPHLDAIFFNAVDNDKRSKSCCFNQRPIDFFRCRVERLAKQHARQPHINQDRSITVVPIQREQTAFTRLQFLRSSLQFCKLRILRLSV